MNLAMALHNQHQQTGELGMELSNLILGFTIKRNLCETLRGARSALPCNDGDSLIIFPHDLKAFAIPPEHISCLVELYQRYLIASGILKRSVKGPESIDDELLSNSKEYDEEDLNYDLTTLRLIHEDLKVPFKEGAFNLDAAINFVEQESGLSRTLAIRWCMMMEYITHEDQRTNKLRNQKLERNQTEPSDTVVKEYLNFAMGGFEDG